MSKIAIVTDSNSGITQAEAAAYGITVIPMPFYINGDAYYEEINLSQEQFYEKLVSGVDISTSMPNLGDVIAKFDSLLKIHDQILYIPMSSGLSSSCSAATAMAEDRYGDKVVVLDAQRISVTQRHITIEALELSKNGLSAQEIASKLLSIKMDSRIYITVDTLTYLKRGGRLTPAVAAIGSLLKIKPVLSIYGDKLDKYAMARSMKQAKQVMIDALRKDINTFLNDPEGTETIISIAHTDNLEAAIAFKEELNKEFPNVKFGWIDPLSLSVSCHIGPGSLACTVTRRLLDAEKYDKYIKE